MMTLVTIYGKDCKKWRLKCGVLCDMNMPLTLKRKVCHMVARPILLYGLLIVLEMLKTHEVLPCQEA